MVEFEITPLRPENWMLNFKGMDQNGINGIWKYCNRATTVWSSQHHYLWFITGGRFLSCCYLRCFPDPSCGATMKSWAEAVGHLKSFLMQLMPSAPRFPVLFKTPTLDRLDENGRMDWWTHFIIFFDFLQLIISHQENSSGIHWTCHTFSINIVTLSHQHSHWHWHSPT